MKKYILTLILALASLGLYAQPNRNKTFINAALHGWEYEIKAGVNLGGTAPLPFPEEIRSIDGYNPTLSITIEGNMTKWQRINDYRYRVRKRRAGRRNSFHKPFRHRNENYQCHIR